MHAMYSLPIPSRPGSLVTSGGLHNVIQFLGEIDKGRKPVQF